MNRFSFLFFFLTLHVSFPAFSMLRTPLSASLGNAGRSGFQAAEFHILNPATILHGDPYQLSGIYYYTQNQMAYGLSITNSKNIPIGVTWIKQGAKSINVFSIAGTLSQQIFLGASIHRYSKNENLIPQIGFIYQQSRKLSLSLTGTRANQNISYGLGSRFTYSNYFIIYLDALYEKKEFSVQGGVELVTKNSFSLRLGSVWPNLTLSIGMSLNAYPIKIDYAWTEKEEHILGIRIQSSS